MKLVSFPAPYCHLLSQDQKSSLKEIFKRGLDNEGDAVTAVCLYGSFTANATFSDIDLGRLMEKMRADSIEYELELESNLERQNGYPADVRTLNAAPPGFSYEVISIGQLLVDKNPNHRADFEGYMLKRTTRRLCNIPECHHKIPKILIFFNV